MGISRNCNFEYTYFTKILNDESGFKIMNLCFVIGKIISDIEFKFIINGKNISVAIFEIQLENNSIIKVKGYNEIADYCYQKLVKGEIVMISGNLNNNMEIELNDIKYF